MAVQAASSGVADLTFPPIRNENGSTMTLRYVVKDSSNNLHSYFTQFIGGQTDVTLIGTTYNHNASVVDVSPASIDNYVTYTDPVSGHSETALLQTLLTDTTGEFDRIYLEAGTYTIDYSTTSPTSPALTISRPIQLDGSPNAILSFTANSTPPSSTSQGETDYGDAIAISSSHVTLSNFQVRFPNQVYFNSGTAIGVSPPSASGKTITPQLVDVNFQNLNVQGSAPAEHFSINGNTGQRQDANGISTLDGYGNDGLRAQSLIDCSDTSGTIENCTLRGGTIEFDGGPWNVIGNTYLGTVPTDLDYSSTYANTSYQNLQIPSNTPEIFASSSPHDQVILDNSVSETQMPGAAASTPLGFAYRFLLYNGGEGYNNLIKNNFADNGVGLRLGSDTSPGGSFTPSVPDETYHNLFAAPEFVLNEEYRVDYEGTILGTITASNAQVLSIPPPSVTFYRQPVQAGDVVAILSGSNAGQYDTIAQVLDSSDFLMQTPLPSGSYQVSICQGLVGSRYIGNEWDLTGTTSVGFAIQGNQFGPQLSGNTITGDYTTVIDGQQNYYVNSGIELTAGYVDVAGNDDNTGYVYPYPVPTEQWTHDVIFGAVVDDNTINGAARGITAETIMGGNSDLGLTYLSASITNSFFEGYGTAPTATGYADFSSVLTIGYLRQNSPTSNSGPRRKTLAFADLNSSGNVIPNPTNSSSGYAPNVPTDEPSADDTVEFGDPNAIHVTLAGNWYSPSGTTDRKDMTIVSAVVNSVPIVYDPIASVSPLPTTTLFEAATDGTASDSSQSNDSGGQGAAQAFDGNIASKWLTFASSGYLEYQFPTGAAYAVTEYALTAGSDTSSYPDRAPKDWMFQGSNDGVTWITLDTETNQADTLSGDTQVYSISNGIEFHDYRLDITSNNYNTSSDNDDNGIIQLAELQLFAGIAASFLTNVTTGGTASDSGNDVNSQGPSLAFDGDNSTSWLISGSSGDLEYTFASGSAYVVTQYTMVASSDTSTYPDRAPRSWEFQGYDGTRWVTLDTEINQADTVSGDIRSFSIANETAYESYRLDILDNNYDIAGDNDDNGLIQLAGLLLQAVVPTDGSTQLSSVATGGTASDSSQSNDSGGQGAAQAFDGNIASKWLTFSSSGYVEYQFGGGSSYAVSQYAITAGSDTSSYPDRAPSSWTFQGYDGTNWVPLDTETDQPDIAGGDTRVYSFNNTTAYQSYRLDITASNYDVSSDNGGNGIMQLAELQLFAFPTSSPMAIVARGGPAKLDTVGVNMASKLATRNALSAGSGTSTDTERFTNDLTILTSDDITTWITLPNQTNQAGPIDSVTNKRKTTNIMPFRYHGLSVVPCNDDENKYRPN